MSDALVKRVKEEIAELEQHPLTVTRVMVPEEGPPKYNIAFNKDTPMFKTRLELEKLYYDVGQRMNGTMLAFYATKRVEKSEGWKV
jgi:hypothetical protein